MKNSFCHLFLLYKEINPGELPGDPVIGLCFCCQGPGFDPEPRNQDPTSHVAWHKKKRNFKKLQVDYYN